ncbi:MAG: hypothetical protein M1814_005522 [Vezdaea aestivalis]|nr:MAG: hypothetical protein M1814_005522 [Vezdaea aestivalis]
MFSFSPVCYQTSRICRQFATHATVTADFANVVIGAGVVGLAVARRLTETGRGPTLLVEKNDGVGQETSSRNSEVIHAGLYYGADSLKTKLCLKGKHMLYDLCRSKSIPYRNTKKWIVAQSDEEWDRTLKLHQHAKQLGIPTRAVSLEEGKLSEPDVHAGTGILESESTGIVDSHSLMQYLLGAFQEQGGDVALNSSVDSISQRADGIYELAIEDSSSSTRTIITTETLVNSAGLGAVSISNMLLPEYRQKSAHYCKGSYFSYSFSHPKPKTLVYPAPSPGHGGLGTHLTVDLAGQVRFGPDVEWVDDPTDLSPEHAQLDKAYIEIIKYMPGIKKEALSKEYSGIRPKLARASAVAQGAGFQDFYIRHEPGYNGFINLLGIESPGLTSSLAIAEEVEELLYE